MSTGKLGEPAQPPPARGVQVDLAYVADEDRIRVTVRRPGEPTVGWWWTRRLTLRVIEAWVGRLAKVPLPAVEGVAWLPPPAARNLAQEHALSVEFDGPRPNPDAPASPPQAHLVHTVHLNIDSVESVLQMVAPKAGTRLQFTRRESHAMLEALASKARQAAWLDAVVLPDWLGSGTEASN